MIKDGKLQEIVAHYLLKGEEDTLQFYDLKHDTLRRYINKYEKENGNIVKTLSDIRNKYTDSELKIIANGSRPVESKSVIYNLEGDVFTFGIASDQHLGSVYTDLNKFDTALNEFVKQGCDFVTFPGDLIEGVSSRQGHVFELTEAGKGIGAQKKLASSILRDFPITTYMIDGNHCLWSKKAVGYSPIEDIADSMPNGIYLGEHEGDISVNGIEIKLWHGQDGATAYALSYRIQGIINSLSGGEKPNIMITGHDHKSMYLFYRNVHCIAGGALQNQSQFMRTKKSQAHVGFWIVKACIGDNEVKWIEPRWYPFYK